MKASAIASAHHLRKGTVVGNGKVVYHQQQAATKESTLGYRPHQAATLSPSSISNQHSQLCRLSSSSSLWPFVPSSQRMMFLTTALRSCSTDSSQVVANRKKQQQHLVEQLRSDPNLWAAVETEMKKNSNGEYSKTTPPASSTGQQEAAEKNKAVEKKSWPLLFMRTALPFFGFGVCDNLIMIGAGQQIDQHFGVVMGFSTMIAAGLGQAVSDGSGVTIQQMIERNEHRLGIPDHGFTEEELNNDKSFGWILQMFRTIGIVIGCLIGLIPVFIFDAGNEPRLYEAILAQLPDDKKKRISAQASTVTYKEGDFICKHGGEIDAIYYITRGEVSVIGRDDNDQKIEICQQKCGVVVGYLELVFGHKIVADVQVTSSKLEAKRIPRSVFEAEVGPPGSSGREWLLEEVKNYVKNEPDLVAYRMRHPEFFTE